MNDTMKEELRDWLVTTIAKIDEMKPEGEEEDS